MHLTFGLGFDAYQHPDEACLFDAIVVGENGLLSLLEERLGIIPPEATHAARILACEKVIETLVAQGDFPFAASFALDSTAVAKHALLLRDELVLAGWVEGKRQGASIPRLAALSQIDGGLCRDYPDSANAYGDRIQIILERLTEDDDAPGSIGIGPVEHLGKQTSYPFLWERLLTALGSSERPVPEPAANPSSSLGRAVAALIEDGGACADDAALLQDDRTLRIVTGSSESTLAEHLAVSLDGDTAAGVTMIAEGSDFALDASLIGQGLPAIGLVPRGGLATPYQLLPLAIATVWDPWDPAALIAFLDHPHCPVHWHLRHGLLKRLRDRPGWDSDEFERVLARVAEELERASQDLKTWVLRKRYPLDEGIPAVALAEVARSISKRLSDLARHRKKGFPELAGCLKGASGIASRFAELVEEDLGAVYSPGKIAALLRELAPPTSSVAPAMAAVGHPRLLSAPDQVLDHADEIVWWGFVDSEPARRPWWTAAEAKAVAADGGALRERLPDFDQILRPFLAASKSLTLYVPRTRGGKPTRQHPLLDRLHAAQVRISTLDLDLLAVSEDPTEGMEQTESRPLPQLRRLWEMEATDLYTKCKRTSYTGVRNIAFAPQDWVFANTASLYPGKLVATQTPIDARLKGTLIHHVAEVCFGGDRNAPDLLDSGTSIGGDTCPIRAWIGEHWDGLAGKIAAPCLLPGARFANIQLRDQAIQTIHRLATILRHLGTERVEMERWLEAEIPGFDGGTMRGSVDLIAHLPDGRTAVIDLKLGGAKGHREAIEKGTCLQLAVYAQLIAASDLPAPAHCGFFSISSGKLICPTADLEAFGDEFTEGVEGDPPATLDRVWQEFLKIWEWRRKQFADGRLENPALEQEEPDPDHPAPNWHANPGHNRFTDYAALHGWKPTQ